MRWRRDSRLVRLAREQMKVVERVNDPLWLNILSLAIDFPPLQRAIHDMMSDFLLPCVSIFKEHLASE